MTANAYNPKIAITAISHHRNGIHGEPFRAVLFVDTDGSRKVAVVFADPMQTAVLDVDLLAADNITFGENSWRGDTYDAPLRRAITAADAMPLITESE